jgi:hypothetical protein
MNDTPASEIPISWSTLLGLLPRNLSELAKGTGSVLRWRKVRSGEDLLWLCLCYGQTLLAIRTVAGMSVGIGGLKEPSIRYRLRKAGPFLVAILSHVLGFTPARCQRQGLRRTLRLQDATTLSAPGSTGTDWRLHVVFVPGQGLISLEITDAKGGESLVRGDYDPGDVVIADQGLAHSKGLHHVRQVGATSLVRVYLQNIKLSLDETCQHRVTVEELLDRADRSDEVTTVYLPVNGHTPIKARLLVRAMPPDNAKAARAKLMKRASRKQTRITPLALRLAGYVALFTTLDVADASDDEVFHIYRIRWQIELYFKRCKSLLGLDALDAQDPELVTTFCVSKFIEAVIIEQLDAELLDQHAAIYPKLAGDPRPRCSIWRTTVLLQDAFRMAIFQAFPLTRGQWPLVIEAMREGKRRRRYASDWVDATHQKLNRAA